MSFRRISYDPFRGVETAFWYDWSEDRWVIRTSQNVDGVLDRNKAAQNEGVDRKEPWRHVASIPVNVWNQWLNEGMPRHNKAEQRRFIQRKLADPDNQYLKTSRGSPFWTGYRKPKLYLPDGSVKAL